MEHSKGFNLDEAIANYLNSIPQGNSHSIDRGEWLDYFMQETSSLMSNGLSGEEAFLICRLRFGDRDLVIQEYTKTEGFFKSNSMILKTVFFTVSFSMILSLNPYFSFFSSWFLSQYIPASSQVFLLTDALLKVVFIGFSLVVLFRNLFRKKSVSPDTYGIFSILYILVLIVLYFIHGFLPVIKPEIQSVLWENTLWVNVAALFALILYSIYLTSKEVHYKLDVVS